MKKIIIVGTFLLGGFLFSQVKIPQKSSKGVINTSTDLKINYTHLIYQKGKVTFINTETGKEEFLYDNSVKSIVFDSEPVNGNLTESESPTTEAMAENVNHLHSKQPATTVLKINNFINNADYIKAKKLSQLGTGFLVGGGACFLVGGILNLSSSSETVSSPNQNIESKGSPVPLIIGLAGMGAGLIMKISGSSQMKRIKTETASNLKPVKEYYLVTNNNGLGMKINF
ncbi:hypothetical protein [Chryseobacterium sp. MDT2-18]|uniref:hypothetical protein n=1 Tax=Chryseobacterium sp. MDT2-18 TaxID=1259136 RepID=UPI00277F6369|nr:hypothetical protein [Chryseobacterium sp. MDT2-18]MDQ0475525.1 hypothetical protein [Chryseobacterium sp. MDT2-18]